MERMTKIDENIQTAQNILSGIIERCYELEKETKKLNYIIPVLVVIAIVGRMCAWCGYVVVNSQDKAIKKNIELIRELRIIDRNKCLDLIYNDEIKGKE